VCAQPCSSDRRRAAPNGLTQRIALETQIEDLLNDAREWDEAREIRVAPDALESQRRELLDEIRRHAPAAIFVSPACPFCQAQAAQLHGDTKLSHRD